MSSINSSAQSAFSKVLQPDRRLGISPKVIGSLQMSERPQQLKVLESIAKRVAVAPTGDRCPARYYADNIRLLLQQITNCGVVEDKAAVVTIRGILSAVPEPASVMTKTLEGPVCTVAAPCDQCRPHMACAAL